MEMVSPVMYDESLEARNETRAATSSGSPKRPRGICFFNVDSSRSFVISDLINPGAMALTVTFRAATSCARA